MESHFFSLFFLLQINHYSADIFGADAPVLPPRDMELTIDLAKLSHAAYQSNKIKPFGNESQGYWTWKKAGYMESGLNWTLYERKNPNGKVQRVLSFAGTEIRDRRTRKGLPDIKDWLTNIHQAIYLGSSEKTLPAQYADALKVAKFFIDQKDKGENMSLTLTGHSLGGGLAQFVSLHTGIRAFVYNSAPLGIGIRTTKARINLDVNNIVNIHLRGDAVHELIGKQLGRQYMIEPAPGTPEIYSGYVSGPTLDFLKRHELGVLISSLKHYKTSYQPLKTESDFRNKKLPLQEALQIKYSQPENPDLEINRGIPPVSNIHIGGVGQDNPPPPPVPILSLPQKPIQSYRLPSDALSHNKRGGVLMKTDVVKGQPADFSGMFGDE